jgi:uncharacterized protein
MDIRFLCDRNLGRLVKWLRILGYDTLWDRGMANMDFLGKAWRAGRIALTRKRDLDAGGSERLIVVKGDRVEEQICEILEILSIKPDPADRMTLCLRCNAKLEAAMESEVEDVVPEYVCHNRSNFKKCPICKRIYWPGTHARNVEKMFRMRIPTRLL